MKDYKYKLALEGSVKESQYFFFETEPKSSQELDIIFGGFEICAPDFKIDRLSYPYYVLEIPISGKCYMKINKHNYQLIPGFIGAFPPGVSHQYICDRANPLQHIFIVFTGTQAQILLDRAGFENGKVIAFYKTTEINYLSEIILKKGLEKAENACEICTSYLKTLLLEMSTPEEINSGQTKSPSTAKYRACRKYIDTHFSEILLPSEVAKKCNVNVRYMSRLFKKHAQITPHEYIMRLKLNKAANLLLTTSARIKDIAEEVGFVDPYHFSRNFKKFHSLSPQDYRKTHILRQ